MIILKVVGWILLIAVIYVIAGISFAIGATMWGVDEDVSAVQFIAPAINDLRENHKGLYKVLRFIGTPGYLFMRIGK